MASFTDIIPKFNPYIQQLPVEAMVQVGMAKQQAYEQNVTKIQSQVDAIGGLDVSRDVDRKYLQSKINELGSKLNRLASADFSNFQLVNAVGGMTNQVVKDGVIQTAVNSTAWARKQREKIEKGKADGTWSIENEDLYNTQYSKWYNGTQAGEVFSSEYVPYRDVYKKLRDIAKDVGVDESLVQNLFNPDGTVNKVMVETYSKGRDPNKIYEAFVTGIDQSDYRQLAITGRYKYKGYTNEQLTEMLQASNDEYTQLANGRKLDLQQRIKLIDQTLPTVKKPEEKKNLEDQRTKVLEAISKIDEQVAESNLAFDESRTKLASGDEDYANSVRARIHTNKFLSTLSRDFADKNSYVKFSENPLWKANMEEQKFAFDVRYKTASLDIERRKAAAAEKANKLKEEEVLALSTPGPIEGGAPATRGNITTTYRGLLNDRQADYNKLALSAFDGNAAALEKYVNSAMGTKIKDPKTGQLRPQTRDEVLQTVGMQEYTRVASILNDKTGKYGSATKLAPDIIERATRISALNSKVSGMQSVMDQLEKEAYSELAAELGTTTEELRRRTQPSTVGFNLDNRGLRWGVGAMSQVSRPAPKNEIEIKLDEKLDEKYKKVFSGFYPDNLGFIMTDKNRDLVVGKLNNALYKNPLYTEDIRKALLENQSQVMLTSVPSLTGFGGTSYAAVITGKDGKQSEPIPITPEQYKFLSNKEAPTVDIDLTILDARIRTSPDNSTNLQGIGKWQTSLVPGTMFTGVRSHNLGGMDLLQSTMNRNLYYPMLYIAPPGSSDYQTIPIQSGVNLSEGLALPSILTDAKLKSMGINF